MTNKPVITAIASAAVALIASSVAVLVPSEESPHPSPPVNESPQSEPPHLESPSGDAGPPTPAPTIPQGRAPLPIQEILQTYVPAALGATLDQCQPVPDGLLCSLPTQEGTPAPASRSLRVWHRPEMNNEATTQLLCEDISDCQRKRIPLPGSISGSYIAPDIGDNDESQDADDKAIKIRWTYTGLPVVLEVSSPKGRKVLWDWWSALADADDLRPGS